MTEEQASLVREMIEVVAMSEILEILADHAKSQAAFAFGLYEENHSQPDAYEVWQNWEAVKSSLKHAQKAAESLEAR